MILFWELFVIAVWCSSTNGIDTDEAKKSSTNDKLICEFGNSTYSPGERWKPNIGFGLLKCVLCGCVRIRRKFGEKTTRVRCHNIESDCPNVKCDKPYQSEDSCCMLCPEDNSQEIEEQIFMSRAVIRPRSLVPVTSSSLTESDIFSSRSIMLHNAFQSLKESPVNRNRRPRKLSSYQDDSSNNMLADDQDYRQKYKCHHKGQILDEGSQWKSSKCVMCSCQKGNINCEQEKCPPIQCKNSVHLKEQCCPVCLPDNQSSVNETRGCFFESNQKFHLAASSWHPYLPPFGYDSCVLCTCMPQNLSITCNRICPLKNSTTTSSATNSRPKKERSLAADDPNVALRSGESKVVHAESGSCIQNGKVYANGQIWNPFVQALGPIKCVTCICKNSVVRYQRLKKCF